ncbi:hypothetical protein BPAE_0099g00180 [Botrytis paeoniae]|uniref:Uncharacterized protein n=1 Tax=Botrytis paeoniae TaxID=278948 RepID=A0A4Z1FP54_9HELO|nr:hypothetical protein BPAE_0099g00180 [Botrytis paeoniae]
MIIYVIPRLISEVNEQEKKRREEKSDEGLVSTERSLSLVLCVSVYYEFTIYELTEEEEKEG